MKINIDEMPENKTFDDYPSDTEFVLRENFPRYDRFELEKGNIVRVYPDDPNYNNALTREEFRAQYCN